jgi:DNA-binding transcriptional LysR family regulator
MVISTCVKIQNFHMVLSALMMSFLIFLPLL